MKNNDSKKHQSDFDHHRTCYLTADGNYCCQKRCDDTEKRMVAKPFGVGNRVKQGQYLFPVRDAVDSDKVTLIPVSKEFYTSAYREIGRKRKRLQRAGECRCPYKVLWKCDGDCERCRYHFPEQPLSLDAQDDEGISLGDTIADDKPLPEDIVADKELLEALLQELKDLDQHDRKMCAVMPVLSERQASALMNTPKTTLRRQWLQLATLLRNNLKRYQ